MAKKTNPTPAKTAKKKTVTMADLHKQQDRIEDRLKQMEERLHASITQREPLFENIERMVNKTAYGVRDQGKAFDQRLSAIERLLATPQDVTGTPADIPDQGLEPGDYTDASKEVADALTAMGFKWGDGDRTECAYIAWEDVYNMILNSTCHDENKLPQAEFLSRAAVTAKKLGLVAKEEEPWKVGDLAKVIDIHKTGASFGVSVGDVIPIDSIDSSGDAWFNVNGNDVCLSPSKRLCRPSNQEVAKYHADQEAAKPIVPYVTRVMCDGYEWRVICGMDQLKRYRIHRIEGEFEYCVSVQRHEFTVIDP